MSRDTHNLSVWKIRVSALAFVAVILGIALAQRGELPEGSRGEYLVLVAGGFLIGLALGVSFLVLAARHLRRSNGNPVSPGAWTQSLTARWTIVPLGAGVAGILALASPMVRGPVMAVLVGFLATFAFVPHVPDVNGSANQQPTDPD